jgi:hypothetical protein
MQVNNKFTSLFSILPANIPNNIVDSIYDFSGQKEELKKYFQRNVLTLVDPTLCFLSSKECDSCFLHDCKIRISGELGPFDKKVCFGCHKVRNGDVMVSAHSADQQWRAQYRVLSLCGVEQWKQSILTWTQGSNERGGPRYSVDQQHPVMTTVLVYRSALLKSIWAEEVVKVARSAMRIGF